MKKMYEDRILSITTDSEEILREAIANSDKTLASIRNLYETQASLFILVIIFRKSFLC